MRNGYMKIMIKKIEAIRRSQTKCALKKEWFCDICNNQKNYSMAGKWSHIKTGKHQKNIKLDRADEKDLVECRACNLGVFSSNCECYYR